MALAPVNTSVPQSWILMSGKDLTAEENLMLSEAIKSSKIEQKKRRALERARYNKGRFKK